MASFPASLSSLSTSNVNSTVSENTHPALHNNANEEINAIEAALGTYPQGSGYVNVKSAPYSAKGDGSTDDAEAIQKAINAIAEAGGGKVFLPAATYIIGTTLKLKNNVVLEGVRTASILKLKNTTNVNVLSTETYSTTGQDNYTVRNLAINGNKENNATAGMGFASNGRRVRVESVYIFNCREDGFNHKQGASDLEASVGGQDSMAYDLWCWNNSRHGIYINSHDFVLIGSQGIANTKSGVYIDTSGFACVLTNVHVWGAQEFGFNFNASFDAMNCQAEGASSAMIRCVAGGRWTGGRVFVAGTPENVPGFEIVENSSRVMISNVEGSHFGTAAMFKFTNSSAGSGSQISATNNETGLTVSGTPSGNIKWDIRLRGGATYGSALAVPTEASATEMEFENLLACKVSGTTEIKKIKAGQPGQELTLIFTSTAKLINGENLKLKSNFVPAAEDAITLVCDGINWYEVGRNQKLFTEIASANTMIIPGGVTLVKVTGTTEIKKITATYAGHEITLLFASGPKVKQGENLKIAETEKTYTSDDTLALICDGTNWYQLSNAANP